jgi:hypothetical protein
LNNNKSFESILYPVNDVSFNDIALRLFHFQAEHNAVYSAYLENLRVDPQRIATVAEIPFLPISFFKSKILQTGDWKPETRFQSSGTTGMTPSIHYVKDVSFYLNHAKLCFEYFFGPLENYHFFALLPSYLERGDSSLVAMINYFIAQSKSDLSGFYLSDMDKLMTDIFEARKNSARKIIVWGVSYALLDLAEKMAPDLHECLVFETGGMKGQRKEITRKELHGILTNAFQVPCVHSEYGMTELFSQAYTRGAPVFYPSPWMKVLIREVGDPFAQVPEGRPGGINIIDLANCNTIAFIETEDAGVLFKDGSFEVQGRLDNSDVRGCNLLVE